MSRFHAIGLAILAALLASATIVAADENSTTTNESQSKDAWVKDCPPDMMCAYGGGDADADGEVRYKDEQPPAEGEGKQAWVDDCPPGMMCAFNGGEEPTNGSEPRDVEGRGPADCANCRGASTDGDAPVDDGASCMDGAQEGESCRDDIAYMTPPKNDASADAEGENRVTTTRDESPSNKNVPALGALAALAALGAIAVLAARRK